MKKISKEKNKKEAPQKIFSAQQKKLELNEAVLKADEKLNVNRGKNREFLIKRLGKRLGFEEDLEKLRRYHALEKKLNRRNVERTLGSLKEESLAIAQRQSVLKSNLSKFIKAHPQLLKKADTFSVIKERPDYDHAEFKFYPQGNVIKEYHSELNIEDFNTYMWSKAGLQQVTAYKRSKLFVIRELVYHHTPGSAVKMVIKPFIMASGHYWENTINTCFEDNIAEVGCTVKTFAEQRDPSGELITFGPGISGHIKDIWAEGAQRQLSDHSSQGNNQQGHIDFYGNWNFGPIFLWPDREVEITIVFELYSHVRGESSDAYIDFYSYRPNEYIVMTCLELEIEPV